MSITDQPSTILVADQFEVTRSQIANLLTSLKYRVIQAVDGSSAIKVIQENIVDIAIFDHQMAPTGGFEIARYIHGLNLNIPCILMTADKTSDLLSYARELGIQHILAKPVDPHRLTSLVAQIFARLGHVKPVAANFTVSNAPLPLTPEQIMRYVIELARKNVINEFGGPYASAVTDANGYILGEGVNLHSSRFDPIAHAEIMAIRKATETLQQTHLEGCSIYSTSEPTRLARAMIDSVGITNIYFGLRLSEIHDLKNDAGDVIAPAHQHPAAELHRLCRDDVLQLWRDTVPLS
jgi:guanine deaminase